MFIKEIVYKLIKKKIKNNQINLQKISFWKEENLKKEENKEYKECQMI